MKQPELLRAAGLALYPERRWKFDMAQALDVGVRRVRHWAAGEETVPPGVWTDIETLLSEKKHEIERVMHAFR